jgi:hypothetical protein
MIFGAQLRVVIENCVSGAAFVRPHVKKSGATITSRMVLEEGQPALRGISTVANTSKITSHG